MTLQTNEIFIYLKLIPKSKAFFWVWFWKLEHHTEDDRMFRELRLRAVKCFSITGGSHICLWSVQIQNRHRDKKGNLHSLYCVYEMYSSGTFPCWALSGNQSFMSIIKDTQSLIHPPLAVERTLQTDRKKTWCHQRTALEKLTVDCVGDEVVATCWSNFICL